MKNTALSTFNARKNIYALQFIVDQGIIFFIISADSTSSNTVMQIINIIEIAGGITSNVPSIANLIASTEYVRGSRNAIT